MANNKLDNTEKKYTDADLDKLLKFVTEEDKHGQSADMFIWETTRAKVIHFFKEEINK